jgi:hypothetical protein
MVVRWYFNVFIISSFCVILYKLSSKIINNLTRFGHGFQLADSSVQIVFGASLGDSFSDFPVDPSDHVFAHGFSFGVVDGDLVVQSLFDGGNEIGFSVQVFGFKSERQVVLSLFLDHGETGGLFLQSVDSVDFGLDQGDFVVFPGLDLAVSEFELNGVFSVNEWSSHVWNELVSDEDSHTHGHGGFWSHNDPFFGDSGQETTPEEHVWSAVAGLGSVLGKVTFWQKGHSSHTFIVSLGWRWWEWTGISVWSAWHLERFPVIHSVDLASERVGSLRERVSDGPGQHD